MHFPFFISIIFPLHVSNREIIRQEAVTVRTTYGIYHALTSC